MARPRPRPLGHRAKSRFVRPARLAAKGGRRRLVPGVRAIVTRLASFADAPTSVLVSGEPGVGKRALGRLIHDRGLRRERPFVTLGVLEHAPEAVLGALAEALAEAGRGTLLIDRVDALAPPAREKLTALLRNDRAARGIATALPTFRAEAMRASCICGCRRTRSTYRASRSVR